MKRLFLIFLVLILVTVLALPVMAEENAATVESTVEGEAITAPEEDPEGSNGIVEWFKAHFSDIISVVTLIVAAVIAFINKSGLMPMIKSGFHPRSSGRTTARRRSPMLQEKQLP